MISKILIFNGSLITFHSCPAYNYDHSHAKTYQNDGQQVIRQANPITTTTLEKTFSSNQISQEQQAPVRWRTTSDQKINAQSIEKTNFTSSYQQSATISIEAKHEELRRRIVRIRTLTTHQDELRKQLESNETILNEQLRTNNLENLELRSIQMLVNSIHNCIR